MTKNSGLGKTVLAILDIQREIENQNLLPNTKKRKRIAFQLLFLVHTITIRDAAFIKFKEHFQACGWPSHSFINVNNSFDESQFQNQTGEVRFIFCLFQSFDKIPNSVISNTTHVIFDEVHHLLATTYNRVFTTLSELKTMQYMLGMTATLIHRDDPKGWKLYLCVNVKIR